MKRKKFKIGYERNKKTGRNKISEERRREVEESRHIKR